mgnify:CR=1 FL=1
MSEEVETEIVMRKRRDGVYEIKARPKRWDETIILFLLVMLTWTAIFIYFITIGIVSILSR